MDYIYSKYASDADWQELLHDLVHDIPKRLEAIDTAVAKLDTEALSFLVHQLKGACGSYGYEEVTALASRLENAIHRDAELNTWLRELADFKDALQRMTDLPAPTNCPK